MVHEDYNEMIPARALSALDTAEDRALTEHLSDCNHCRGELRIWEDTAASLALDTNPLEPSPQLRDRILMKIQTELRSSKDKENKASHSARVIPIRPAPGNVWTYIGSAGAIAAAVLFVSLMASVFILWKQNRAAEAEVATLLEQVRASEQQSAQARNMMQFLTEAGNRVTTLTATTAAPNAHAVVAYDQTGRALLLASGLPVAPAGKTYQLWYIVGGKPLPGKLFTPDHSGNVSLQDQLPTVVQKRAVFAITLEPEGGVQTPSGAFLLRSGS
jgi:anti-sigma-K factor RskA